MIGSEKAESANRYPQLRHGGGTAHAATGTTTAADANHGPLGVTPERVGAAETVALSFLDLAERGAISRDWPTLTTGAFAQINAPTYGMEVDYASPPASGSPALPAESYTGTFISSLYGDLAVEEDEERLVMRLGPAMTAYPLARYDRDVFSYQPIGENA